MVVVAGLLDHREVVGALARGPLPSKDRFSGARHFEIVDIAVAPPIPHDPTRNAMVPGQ
jgi:hypothetical protein